MKAQLARPYSGGLLQYPTSAGIPTDANAQRGFARRLFEFHLLGVTQ